MTTEELLNNAIDAYTTHTKEQPKEVRIGVNAWNNLNGIAIIGIPIIKDYELPPETIWVK